MKIANQRRAAALTQEQQELIERSGGVVVDRGGKLAEHRTPGGHLALKVVPDSPEQKYAIEPAGRPEQGRSQKKEKGMKVEKFGMHKGVAAVARQLHVDQKAVPSAPKLPPGREERLRAFAEIYEQHPEHALLTDQEGNTPLHAAVSSGREDDIVCYLAAKCPEAALRKNAAGHTPVDLAKRESRSKVVKESLKRAAKEALRAHASGHRSAVTISKAYDDLREKAGHGKGSDGQSSPTRPALEGGGEAGAQDEEGAQGLLEGGGEEGGEEGGGGGGAQYRSLGAGDEGGTSSETALVPVGKSKEVTDIEKTVGDEAEAYAREVRQSGKSSTLYYSQPFAKKIPEAPHMDRKPRVLFIGNSLTYYSGGIDRYVVRIQEFRAERYTKAGATLEDLWNEGGAAERIAEGGWAVVVLQDDLPEGSSQSFDEYGAKFVEKIREVGARPLLLMAWAYSRLPAYSLHHIARAHMKLSERLQVTARPPPTPATRPPTPARDAAPDRASPLPFRSQVEVAPVGIAFQRTHRHMDELVRGQGVTRFHLLTRDGEHPSPCGQLLSALVVAITITGTSPHTLKWWVPDGIETKQAQFMRGVAGQTVLEWLGKPAFPDGWRI